MQDILLKTSSWVFASQGTKLASKQITFTYEFYLEREVCKIILKISHQPKAGGNDQSPVNHMHKLHKLGYFLFPVSAEKANTYPKSKHEMDQALDMSEQQESILFFA